MWAHIAGVSHPALFVNDLTHGPALASVPFPPETTELKKTREGGQRV